MRKSILITFLFSLTYFGVSQTFAQCTCAAAYRDITPHDEYKLADVVFVGEVVEIKNSARDVKTDSYVETVKFKIKKAWKRDLEEVVTITNTIQGCLNGFEEKEEWLVYAYKHRDGTLGTFCCCSRTSLLSKAVEDLKEFEEKGEKPAKVIKAAN